MMIKLSPNSTQSLHNKMLKMFSRTTTVTHYHAEENYNDMEICLLAKKKFNVCLFLKLRCCRCCITIKHCICNMFDKILESFHHSFKFEHLNYLLKKIYRFPFGIHRSCSSVIEKKTHQLSDERLCN